MQEKIYTIKGRQWHFSLDANGHPDISVDIFSEHDYLDLKKKLADPHCSFSNTSSVGIVQNAFAQARSEAYTMTDNTQKMHRMLKFIDMFEPDVLSAPLFSLNELVNQRCINPSLQFDELRTHIDDYLLSINALEKSLNQYLISLELSEEKKILMKEDISALISTLKNNTQMFKAQCGAPHAMTFERMDLLLSAQNRGNKNSLTSEGDTQSLGDFLTQQSRVICETAKKLSKTLDERYVKNVVSLNPISDAFRLGGSKLRVKHALYGREHIDTHEATRQQLINRVGPGRLSIMPYVSGGNNGLLPDLDRVICLISDTPLGQRTLSMPEKGELPYLRGIPRALKFIFLYAAPILDAIIFIPRLLLYPVYKGIRFLLSDENKVTLDLFAQSTFTIWAKRLWYDQYKRLTSAGELQKDDHQVLLNEFKKTKITSLFATFFKGYTSETPSQRFDNELKKHPHQPLLNQLSSLSSSVKRRTDVFFRTFSDTRKPSDIYDEREEAYDRLKPVMDWVKKKSQEAQPKKTHQKIEYYPGPAHVRENKIDSPTRVFSDIMYILNEEVINHLTDTMPGPATFIFMATLGSFGSNLVPMAGIGSVHGLFYAINQFPILVAKSFMGYAGPMGTSHGLFADVLAFKLGNLAVMGAIEATNKNNTWLETLADDPEAVIASFVVLVGLGMAIGYLPQVPSIPVNNPLLKQANIYGYFVNLCIEESLTAQGGVWLLASPEYMLLAYKPLIILNDLIKEGKAPWTATEAEKFFIACMDAEILKIEDPVKRKNQTETLFKRFNLLDEGFKQMTLMHLEHTYVAKNILKTRVKMHQAATEKDIDEIKTIVAHGQKSKKATTPDEQLTKAMQMLGDPDTPLTFSPAQRDDAILFYNHLSQLFDDYNESIKDKPGCFPLPKADYLLAFRNKFCPTGRHIGAGLMRQLSAYPGYPFRWLARELQLLIYKDSPFVIDTIHARREEDIILWRAWGAMALQTTYAFMHLFNKGIKFFVWAPLALYSVTKAILTGKNKETALEKSGRWVDDHVRIDEVTLPHNRLKGRTSGAAHTASDYNDIRAASRVVASRLAHQGIIRSGTKEKNATPPSPIQDKKQTHIPMIPLFQKVKSQRHHEKKSDDNDYRDPPRTT